MLTHPSESRAVCVAIGIDLDGRKDVPGLWISANEVTRFWLQVLTELRNRGLKDIFIASVEGLKGFPQAIDTVWASMSRTPTLSPENEHI